ncbi:elongation factor Ts [Mycoplasmatota bacterium]|nr:elongation factor Ts [Mycoplasmatota bacterium]
MTISAKMVKELRVKTGAGMMDCKKALVETGGNIEEAAVWLREKGISKAAKKQTRIAAEGLCHYAFEGNTAIVFELNCETDFVPKNKQYLTLLDDIAKALIVVKPDNTEEALKVEINGTTIETALVDATFTIGEKITLRRVMKLEKESSQVFGAYKHNGGKIAVITILDGDKEEVAKDIAMHVAAINPSYVDQSQVPQDELEKEKEILKQEALNEGKPEAIVEKMVIGRLNKYLKDICLVNQPFVKDSDITVEKYVKNMGMNIASFTRLTVGEGIEKRVDDFAAEVAAQVGNN